MQLLNAHPHGTVRSTGYHRVPPLRGARRAVCGILRRGERGREREAVCSFRDSRTRQFVMAMILLIPEYLLHLGKPL